MSIEWVLYWIDILNNLSTAFGFIIAISSLAIILSAVGCAMAENFEYFLKIKKYIWMPLLALLIFAFIPSQKTMYMMVGTKYLKQSKLPEKIELVLQKKLDELLVDKKNDHKQVP